MSRVAVEALDVNSSARRRVFDELQSVVSLVACGCVRDVVNASLDAEVDARLGRGRWEPRASSDEVAMPWECHGCGAASSDAFRRNGHYTRGLSTLYGAVKGIRVPMLRCVHCGSSANVEYAALPKHQQLWLDVDEAALFKYGAEEGLRHIGEEVGDRLGWPVSASTIQRRVHKATEYLEQWRKRPLDTSPDVLMLDGIWFTCMEDTDEYVTDAAGRRRPKQRRRKRVAIIALGLWSDSGDTEILDFEIADSESESSCLKLLDRLQGRGISDRYVRLIVSDGAGGICAAIETSYPTVARQRCVVHKLRNVFDNTADTSHRKELLAAASWIYDAQTQTEANQRLEQVISQWSEVEPKAIASLCDDFPASIAYLEPLGISQPERFCTTNAIEGGVMRPIRRRLDCATAYRTEVGANCALFLTIGRLNSQRNGELWMQNCHDILYMLRNEIP